MGIVNVRKGLDDSNLETYNFNGPLRTLDLNWEYAEIYKGSEKLDPDYLVEEDDIILIQELPGGLTTGLIIGAILVGVAGLATGIIAGVKAKQVEKDYKKALERLENQSKKQEQETIPWLSGGRNERAEGKQAPIILGRHLFTPYFLCDPYVKPSGVDGEDLFWYGTFLCGQTNLCLEKIRNGMEDLISFQETEPQRGTFPFDAPANYNPGNTEKPPFYDPENRVEVIQEGYFNDPIFNQKWIDSLESSEEIGRKKSDTQVLDESGIFIEDDGPEPIIRESARFPMRLEIELFVDGLNGWDSKNMVETEAAINVSLGWSVSDNGPWNSISISGWPENNLTRAKSKQMRFVASVNLPASVYSKDGKPVYIRAVRNTRMHTGGYRDRVYLSAIRTKLYNPEKSSGSGLVEAKNINEKLSNKFCRMGIKLKVNKNTEKALDKFNIIASMTARTWNYVWSLNKVKTSNPAAAALEVLTGLIHEPSAYYDNEIDLASFGKLYEFCESQTVKIDGQPVNFKLESNGVLTGASRKQDVIKSILAACDAGLYVNEFGKIIVYYDAPQSIPMALLNPQRIVNMQESRNLNRKADGYKIEFIDQDADWSMDTKEILRPRVIKDPANTFTIIKLDLTTGYNQAMWHARRMMAKEIHRPGEVKINVGKEGGLYRPGSLIKVQHEGFKLGIGSGEIIELIKDGDYITGFRLMEKFYIANDRDYYIDYYVVSEERNRVVNRQIQSVGEYTNKLMLTTPIHKDSTNVPLMGNILSAIAGEVTAIPRIWESKRYLVSGLTPTSEGYELTLVQYNSTIYDTTSIDEIPAYVSSIIKTPPRFGMTPDTKPYDGRSGRDGEDAVVYRLLPSVDSITRDNSGVPTPDTISCTVLKTTGSSAPVTDTTKTIKYITSESTETNYTQSITIPTAQVNGLTFIEFRLYNGSLLIDRSRIPIIQRVQDAPRYLGATNTADTGNTGVVSTNQGSGITANHGDYFMYTGAQAGTGSNIRRPGYMYKWDAVSRTWVELPRPTSANPQNAGLYWDAVNDLTANTPDAYISVGFIKSLIADTAFIQHLFAKHIEMTGNGTIESDGFTGVDGTTPGYRLSAQTGLIEANNVEASNMTVKNIDITGDFQSRIRLLGSSFFGGPAWNTMTTVPVAGTIIGVLKTSLLANGTYIPSKKTGVCGSLEKLNVGRLRIHLTNAENTSVIASDVILVPDSAENIKIYKDGKDITSIDICIKNNNGQFIDSAFNICLML